MGFESINRLVYVSCICMIVMCCFFFYASHRPSITDDQPTLLQPQTTHERLCSKGGVIIAMIMFKKIPIAKCEDAMKQYGCTKPDSSILLSQLRGIHGSKMPPFAEWPKAKITALWLPGATELEYDLGGGQFLLLWAWMWWWNRLHSGLEWVPIVRDLCCREILSM